MDQLTPHERPLAARRKARPIVVDQPQPGYFKLRLHRGCWHAVPARLEHSDGLWSATIDGEPAGLPHADPIHADGVLTIWHKRKTEITEAEYRFLTVTLKEWARAHYPDHPLLDPARKVATGKLRPIPKFGAPAAPAPLSEEPLPENRPTAPKVTPVKQILAWLNYENEPLVEAIGRDILQLQHDGRGTVDDEESLGRVSANVSIAQTHLGQAEKTRKAQKDPFKQGADAVDKWFKRWTVQLTEALEPVQKLMNAYGEKVDAERRAEEARRAAEARAEAERLAARAAEAMARETVPSPATTVLLDAAAEAAKEAERADALATGKTADVTRFFRGYGGVVSGEEVWDFEIEDISKVPLWLLQINQSLTLAEVRAWAKANPEKARAGISPIEGIRIVRSISMRGR